jgi:hypothetical protein
MLSMLSFVAPFGIYRVELKMLTDLIPRLFFFDRCIRAL